jgi:UDP-N-acetylglucosamine 4,6-dehydratase
MDDMFVVQPTTELWFGHGWQLKGKRLPDGFRYASNSNPDWLTKEQIQEMVAPFENNRINEA